MTRFQGLRTQLQAHLRPGHNEAIVDGKRIDENRENLISRLCRIEIKLNAENEGSVFGTGFLVQTGFVLTNYHVIEPIEKRLARSDNVILTFETPESEQSEFGLAQNYLAGNSQYSEFDKTFEAGREPAEHELDYALLRLKKSPTVGSNDFFRNARQAKEGDIVKVFQHPGGQSRQESTGMVSEVTNTRLRYSAATEPGSSGGLVVDDEYKPIAIHHAGNPAGRYNQGILLTKISQQVDGGIYGPLEQPSPEVELELELELDDMKPMMMEWYFLLITSILVTLISIFFKLSKWGGQS